jgi:3-hydroxyisobutyrate dehydrogenase-like beta-hydroxyacid dehydrogenase
MRIAVLGMGQMGRGLAGRLLHQGHEVTVFNRTPGRAGPLVDRGAVEAATAAEAAAGNEVVMTTLAADGAVTATLLPDGVPLPLPADGIVVECSTVAPATTRAVAEAFGGRLVACPILGGPAALEAGDAGLAVAGPPELIDRLRPLWDSLSGHVRRCGDDPGLALVVKLINNYLLMGGLAMLAEAAVVGQRAGLADGFVTDLFSQSPLVAPGLRNRIEDLVAGDHDGWFPASMGAKDVKLLLDVAAVHATALPVAESVGERYDEAARSGLGERDITGVIELVRRPA